MPNNKYNMIGQKFGRLTVVNGDYEPNNCRWITNLEQQNNKRNNVYLTFNGKTQTMAQWSKELNINYNTLNGRHLRGYTDKECLFGRDNHVNEIL